MLTNIPIKKRKRYILHVDADAFFATVEQVLNPTLKGKALIVGGRSPTKGIVSAASYEAKKYGIYSGMPMYLATKQCPKAVIVPPHFPAYSDFSKKMYEVFCRYTPQVEMASIDEAYLDITGCELMHKKKPEEIARSILMEVNKELGISVSGGLASSKIVAKAASSLNKPHKLTVVPFGREKKFLEKLSLRDLPGIGPKTFERLQRFGFGKIGDLSKRSISELIDEFGIEILPLWKHSLGIDDSEVISTRAAPKSISREHTFYSAPIMTGVLKMLRELNADVCEKLRRCGMKAMTITIVIKYRVERKFVYTSFQKVLAQASSLDSEIWPQVKKFFQENVDEGKEIRLIGVGVANLKENYNLSLFGGDTREKEGLFLAMDKIKNLYGEGALRYGAEAKIGHRSSMVEQCFRKAEVPGSSPGGGSRRH